MLGLAAAALFVLTVLVPGTSATLAPGPDGSPQKYRVYDSGSIGTGAQKPSYAFTDIASIANNVAGTRTACVNGAAKCLATGEFNAGGCMPLGFTFTYYGTARDCVYINSDGYLVLANTGAATPAGCNATCQETPVAQPSAAANNPIIAPFWGWFQPNYCNSSTSGGVYAAQAGSSGAKTFTVEWKEAYFYYNDPSSASTCPTGAGSCTPSSPTEPCVFATFEATLNEDSGNIDVQLKSVTVPDDPTGSFPNDAAVGIEDDTGAQGLNYHFGYSTTQIPGTVSSRAVRFFPNHKPVADAQTLNAVQDGPAVSLTLTATDPDDDTFTCAVATPLPSGLSVSGCTVTYTPPAGFCNKPSGTAVDFKWTPTDSLALAGAQATVAIKVSCGSGNAAPTFSLASVSAPDDGTAQTATAFAFALSPGPSSESSQRLRFTTTAADTSQFSVQPSITPTAFKPSPFTSYGDLTFQLRPNLCKSGVSSVAVTAKLQDDGGTANGGTDTTTKTFSIALACPAPPAAPPPAPVGDSDGDGVSDTQEGTAGSDPNNAGSTPDDVDADGVPNDRDNCPDTYTPNGDQSDANGDGRGDACTMTGTMGPDTDQDSVPNDQDNCPTIYNVDQANLDKDGVGDACDNDKDGDGVSNDDEKAAGSDPANVRSTPRDLDGDGAPNGEDNCAGKANDDQADRNHDGVGDACQTLVPLNLTAAAASYDGHRVRFSWTIEGEAQEQSIAEAVDGNAVLVTSGTLYGPGPKTFEAPLDGLHEVSWRIRASDPYDTSKHFEAKGTAVVLPEPAPVQPAVVAQPATAVTGDSVMVAYTLPAGTATATLELRDANGRLAGTTALLADKAGTWRGTLTAPGAGSYAAKVQYTVKGARQVLEAGTLATTPSASDGATDGNGGPLGADASGAGTRAIVTALGVLGGLAAVGLLGLAVVVVARRRNAAKGAQAAQAEQDAAQTAQAPPADSPDYDSPIELANA